MLGASTLILGVYSGTLFLAGSLCQASGLGTSYQIQHADYRNSSKIIHADKSFGIKGQSPAEVANAFLHAEAASLGLNDSILLDQLAVTKVKKSLLATHVHFSQSLNGFPVKFGEIIVSVSNGDQRVLKVFNNYYPTQSAKAKPRALISKEQAFDIAWNDIRAHGSLKDDPSNDTYYVVSDKGEFKLVHEIYLKVSAPFGAWESLIDAESGVIVSVRDKRIVRVGHIDPSLRHNYKGKILDRQVAFREWQVKKNKASLSKKSKRVDGMGLVFDPDPRTTLGNGELMDDTSADAFDAAYFERPLMGISLDAGTYSLKGPWVTLADFESPNTAPATTTDGSFLAKRGDVAFNDAMTYYHIDQNQRYMQALGFQEDTGIQYNSIEVDANGVNGADNSHFIPGANQMAFGHGCVDDNEDSDVILHEYGHAINHSINENWSGGDTGAMGEGFGDYWAGSYSIATENGRDFEVNTVFTWDGAPCWPGRRLDTVDARYDHSRNYGAHSSTPEGHITDELWSTPLFQALLAITELGHPREDVDQIILEAQFGLGQGLKMRDLANATIATATQLFPDKPYAEIFTEKFLVHGIVEVPAAILALGDHLLDGTGDNGVIDPGETIVLTLRLGNRGTMPAEEISSQLTTATPFVALSQDLSSYSDLQSGGTVQNDTPFVFSVADDFQCGEKIDLELSVSFIGGLAGTAAFPLRLSTGVPVGVDYSDAPGLAIPDDTPEGVTAEILVTDMPGAASENFNVDINLEHTYIGDLEITLIAPSGMAVRLHANTGGSDANIIGNYPTTLAPAEDLVALVGESLEGLWKLKVVDSAGQDVGSLISWGIRDIQGYECD
jgi:subtilisin-like proprotein convertase family protein